MKNHPNADSLPNLLNGMVGVCNRRWRAVPDGFASVPPERPCLTDPWNFTVWQISTIFSGPLGESA